MKDFAIKIASEALADIQEISQWYNEQQEGLGEQFKNVVIKQIDALTIYPMLYAVRYEQIRCMVVKKFPYMIHFHIDENNSVVNVLAVISTSRNPEVWKKKTKRK